MFTKQSTAVLLWLVSTFRLKRLQCKQKVNGFFVCVCFFIPKIPWVINYKSKGSNYYLENSENRHVCKVIPWNCLCVVKLRKYMLVIILLK